MMTVVEHVLPVQCKLGEGPLWDSETQSLHWVDIDQHKIHRWFPESNQHDVADVGMPVGVIRHRTQGGLILGTRHGFMTWDWSHQSLHPVADPEADQNNRFNDGAVDNQGRFWAGTMPMDDERYGDGLGNLYRLDSDGTVTQMASNLTIANGLDWSPDNRVMYLTDTIRRVIYAYDFDAKSGLIKNRRDFVHVPESFGYPDGLTVDAEGGIWSACITGGQIVRYTPDGEIDQKIQLPVTCPTACAFGGHDLNELYITTSWHLLSEDERKQYPQAGDVFRVKLGFSGKPANKFAG